MDQDFTVVFLDLNVLSWLVRAVIGQICTLVHSCSETHCVINARSGNPTCENFGASFIIGPFVSSSDTR